MNATQQRRREDLLARREECWELATAFLKAGNPDGHRHFVDRADDLGQQLQELWAEVLGE
jgi:hypothetical protein